MIKFCKCGAGLTTEEAKTTKMCAHCGKKHAEKFHKDFDIAGPLADPLRLHQEELQKGGY